MEMEPTYDPSAVEARWLGRREPGAVLPPGSDLSNPAAEAARVGADVLERWARMGGGDPERPAAVAGGGPAGGGVDAFRLSVAFGEAAGRRAGRLLNKLWHVSRWSLLRISRDSGGAKRPEGPAPTEDRWIAQRLNRAVGIVTSALGAGDLAAAAREADDFVRNALSAVYLPLAKVREDEAVAAALGDVLGTLLALLSPLAPVVTEEIRNHLSRVLGEPPVRLEEGTWPGFDASHHERDAAGELRRKVRTLPSDGEPDPAAERARLRREFESLADKVRAVERDLWNRDFVARAPAEVVARQRERRDELAEALIEVRRRMECMEEVRE